MTVGAQRVKVFGERNTGTRAVIRMLMRAENVEEYLYPPELEPLIEEYAGRIEDVEAKFAGAWRRVYREALRDARQEALGPLGTWKHSAPNYHPAFKEADIRPLFMLRNPYSWLLSLHRRPYHALGRRKSGFSEFLGEPWLAMRRENLPPLIETPMQLWNYKLAAYSRFRADATREGLLCGVLCFEDFVNAPAHALKRVLRQMGLEPEGLNTGRPTKPMGLKARERRHYYGRELWKAQLSSSDVAAINAAIDWDLAATYDYAPLDPAAFPEVAPEATLQSDEADAA